MEEISKLFPIISALVLLVVYLERRFTRLEAKIAELDDKFDEHIDRHHPSGPFVRQG